MEGYFDVISAQAHGIHNAIASCGTSMTLEHVKMLSKYTRSRRIYLSFDTDLAGQNATKRGGELIKSAFSGLGNIKQFDESHISTNDDKYACEIRVVSPPEGKDPDEFIRSSGAEAFKSYIEHAPLLLDFELNQLLKKKNEVTTPQEKSELVKEILPVLNDVQNPIIQSEYVKIVATALSLDDKALQQDVKKVSRTDFIVPEVSSVNVTKSSPIEEIAQKNLLSLFLVNVSPYSTDMISGRIKSVNFTNKTLIIVKDTIDKLINTVNNVSDLTNKLYIEFSQNQEIKSLITDLICISETFNNLKEAEFDAIIRENIETLEKCRLNEEHLQMKNYIRKRMMMKLSR